MGQSISEPDFTCYEKPYGVTVINEVSTKNGLHLYLRSNNNEERTALLNVIPENYGDYLLNSCYLENGTVILSNTFNIIKGFDKSVEHEMNKEMKSIVRFLHQLS